MKKCLNLSAKNVENKNYVDQSVDYVINYIVWFVGFRLVLKKSVQ